jgi:large subunit ribosomal protein L9
MKVILRQNIDSLGVVGQVVNVHDGYALNYLIPRKYAYPALKGNIHALEEEKRQLDRVRNKQIAVANKLAGELEKVQINISMQVGEDEKLFGSVTGQMVADLLTEKGFEIDKRKIVLEEPIKALGIYSVAIKLDHSVTTHIKVWVVRE